MTNNYTIGEDAFNASTEASDNDVKWTKFNSGMSYKVRLFNNYASAVMKFRNYGIYKVVNSFSAKNPSVKNDKGFAESNLTVWDKASQHYAELLFKAMDAKDTAGEKEFKQKAGLYREKERYAVAFGDLDTGLPVHFDISPNQWAGIKKIIVKFAPNLATISFELTKSGKGKDTVVSLMPIMTNIDPLTDKQQANFDKFNEYTFDANVFKGFMYEIDEPEQLQLLTQAGFDTTLIGYTKEDAKSEESTETALDTAGGPIEVSDDDLPF